MDVYTLKKLADSLDLSYFLMKRNTFEHVLTFRSLQAFIILYLVKYIVTIMGQCI